MATLGKPLQIETCNVSITSYTQDGSPITRRAWVDLTFQEMMLVHPLHICTIDTEPLLIGQDLLDRLAPLIDCHRGHIWAQVDTPKPLSQSALGRHVAAIPGTFGPWPKLMPLSEPDPGSDLLLPPPATIQPAPAGNRDSLHNHESFLCALKNTNPAYLVPLDLVTQILKSATTTVVHPSQVHLAYNLGSAIPISVNPQGLEIGFLLNLPIIERQNIYRLKSVLNVGFWKGNTHIHLKTPTSLAYHGDHPSLYLIPNLDMCTKTKDIHWVCPGNPFVRDVTNYLCGLRAASPEQKCQAKMSVKDEQTGTKVERAGNRWLVSTPATEALMSYDRHDTATQLTLPNQTVFLMVPQGATVHIKEVVLHHLNPDRHQVEIEVMDAFQGHNLTIDDTLQQQLLAEGTKLVQLSLKPTGLATTFNSRLSRPSSYQEHHVSLVALGLLLSGWVITAIIAHIMYRHIQTLQTRLDTLRVVQPRFAHQSVSTPRISSSPLQE